MVAGEAARDAVDGGEARMVGLAEILRRSGSLLAQAAVRLAAVEDALDDALDNAFERGSGAATVLRLQDLDALRQEASALGDFLIRLAREAPPLALDAGAALRATPLARLAARLGGEPETADAATQEVELF